MHYRHLKLKRFEINITCKAKNVRNILTCNIALSLFAIAERFSFDQGKKGLIRNNQVSKFSSSSEKLSNQNIESYMNLQECITC